MSSSETTVPDYLDLDYIKKCKDYHWWSRSHLPDPEDFSNWLKKTPLPKYEDAQIPSNLQSVEDSQTQSGGSENAKKNPFAKYKYTQDSFGPESADALQRESGFLDYGGKLASYFSALNEAKNGDRKKAIEELQRIEELVFHDAAKSAMYLYEGQSRSWVRKVYDTLDHAYSVKANGMGALYTQESGEKSFVLWSLVWRGANQTRIRLEKDMEKDMQASGGEAKSEGGTAAKETTAEVEA